jgi:broad specificity phosphatase PhoE
MKLIITRHGKTNENVLNISAGAGIDSLLVEEGVLQAKKLGLRLKTENIDVIYVSDLQRAVHTAKEVKEFHPTARFVVTPHLRERNFGIYEGRPKIEFQQALQNSPLPFHDFMQEEGASFAQLQNRVVAFFDQLIEKHPNETILLVSHGATITMLLLKLFDKPITQENYDAYKPKNTAVTMIEFLPNTLLKIHMLNDISHLK